VSFKSCYQDGERVGNDMSSETKGKLKSKEKTVMPIPFLMKIGIIQKFDNLTFNQGVAGSRPVQPT